MITNTILRSGTRTTRRAAALLAVTVLVAAGTGRPVATAQAAVVSRPAGASVAARVDTYLTRLAKHQLFTGSVLVTRRGNVLLDKGYGLANQGRHVRNTPQIPFLLADVTMQFTAAAILQLQEEGKLRVTGRVSTYLPACPPTWKGVTIRQLLTHTSGIQDLYGDSVYQFDQSKYWSPQQIVDMVRNDRLLFKPGTQFHYSRIGYIALGLIVERVSGEPYGTFLQQHIFGPLGMTHTGLFEEGATVADLASGYTMNIPVTDFDPASFFAAGGLYSTVDDLGRWDRALSTGQLLSRQSRDAMFGRQFPFSAHSGYGYGWSTGLMRHHRVISHGGGMSGVSTLNAILPSDGVTITILSNDERTAMNVIFPDVVDAVLGVR